MNTRLPRPTLVLANLTDSFTFEKLTVALHRFAKPAHTDDHSAWLLKEERIAHSPDLLNPDQLPMMGFAVSDTIVYHESNLREVMALDWVHFVGGHGNVGSKADFEFQIGFLRDIVAATREARSAEAFSKHMNSGENNHAAFARAQRDAIIKRVTEQLRPKYGRMYGYDAYMPYNIELAIRLAGSYY
jgi:glyoxylase-like metal-dependent hydrolase (beta-lactamase superfamily II)